MDSDLAVTAGQDDWVALSPVSAEAVRLYLLLRMHVQAGIEADNAILAALMGKARGDSLTQWVRELVAIGAVSVFRGGMPSRNFYRVVPAPPEGFTGPRTLRARLSGDYLGPVVYFAKRQNGDIKIGYTADLRSRMRQLRRSHGVVEILATEPGGEARERELHDAFRRLWTGSAEWFRPGDGLLAHIDALAGAA